ncbi:MAG: DEAD/DEAH box helicase [Halobacteriaceae archaeon]
MHVGDLPLEDAVVAHLRERGVETLYPPQAAAVNEGVCEGERLLAAIPTAAGKTLVAELAMLTAPGMALYIVPLRALASEKAAEFDALPGVSVGLATGDLSASEDLGDHDVVVATSEKVDSLVRRGADWVADLGCVVADEVHLLDSPDRGPTLEVTLAKLRALNPDLQVVALSATVANAGEVADWLDARLVRTAWRPVELRRGVYHDGRVAFVDGGTLSVPVDDPSPGRPTTGDGDRASGPTHGAATAALVRDAVADGGQCLVFVHSRRAAERLAAALGDDVPESAPAVAASVRGSASTDTGESLAARLEDGVAFHHAGLRPDHREAVESAFRGRDLRVVCATPTLAAGVNVPARRVVVRDHWRYGDAGREPLSAREVQQMCGRAGRPGLDPYGEAVLVADDADQAARLRDRYLTGDPEPVSSKLARPDALRTHVLSTVASGFAETRAELLDVLGGTFYAAQEASTSLVDVVDLLLDDLVAADMLRRDDGLTATPLGAQVSRLYVDPRTGESLVTDLRRSAAGDVRPTARTYLELCCATPDLRTLYLRDRDRARALRTAERRADEFVRSLEGVDDVESWLATLKTVAVLADWAEGDAEGTITDRYGIGPGDLRTAVERATWLLNATSSLADLVGVDVAPALDRTLARLEARVPERVSGPG